MLHSRGQRGIEVYCISDFFLFGVFRASLRTDDRQLPIEREKS